MRVYRCTQEEYENSDNRISLTNGMPSVFGKIGWDRQMLFLGWRSNLVDIELEEYETIIVVGVDDKVLFYDLSLKSVQALYVLTSNLFALRQAKEAIVCIAELEILVINKSNSSILYYSGLPDIIEEFQLGFDQIEIICQDGSKHKIRY